MKLRLIVVGRDRAEPILDAAQVYLERLRRHFPVELVEVKEEPARGSTPIARIRSSEAERLRKALGADDHLVALDERGRALSSVELAERVGRWANEGKQVVSFVIGGPNGLDPGLVASARETWSLSRLTLPHRIARLIFAEQLYRAATILRGEPYHK